MPEDLDLSSEDLARRSLAGHLLREKLLKPVDLSLVADGGVTPESLARESARLIAAHPYLSRLAARSGDELAMRHGLARLPLPPQMALTLTVAREQRPRLFQHLLIVAAIARYLALCLDLSERDTANLLTAALFHDLGELHTDPAVLDRSHRIDDDERRYVYVHPITGYLMAREIAELDRSVHLAILQHQERIDGSGYPYGVGGERIGLLARIVGIADVCASILARFDDDKRLSILMRLNREKYDPRLLVLLQAGLDHTAMPAAHAPLAQLVSTSRLLQGWSRVRQALGGDGADDLPAALRFLFERMVRLRTMLLQFGFDPDSLDAIRELACEDEAVASELSAALDEVSWQFADLVREIERRGEPAAPAAADGSADLLADWIADLRAFARTA